MIALVNGFLELSPKDRRRYLCFSAAFFILIGAHAAARPAKTFGFYQLCGKSEEPRVRTALPLVFLPALLLYNIAATLSPNPRFLVLIVSMVHAILFVFVTMGYSSFNTGGGTNATTSADSTSASTGCALGWIMYLIFEIKGVLLPPMFWSAVNDVSSAEASKRAYVLLVMAGNLGMMLSSVFSSIFPDIATLFFVQSISLVVFALLMWPALEEIAPEPERSSIREIELRAGHSLQEIEQETATAASIGNVIVNAVVEMGREAVAGLSLIATRPFVAGVLVVSWAHILPRSILDYEGSAKTDESFDNTEDKIAFFGKINFLTSAATILVGTFASSSLIGRLGPGVVVSMFPIVVMLGVVVYFFSQTLFMIQAVVLLVNCVDKALNTPVREMLYINTSKDVKYKAKSWGDVYGNIIFKLLGAQVNLRFNSDGYNATMSTLLSVIWCSFWLGTCSFVHKVNQRLEANGEKIS